MGNEESNQSQTIVNGPMNSIESSINTNMAYYECPQGKMEEVSLITLSLNANSFSPGDIIKGAIIIEPKMLIKVSQIIVKLILIQGLELPQNKIKNMVTEKIFESINLSQYDNLKNGVVTLYPNKYVFDFNLKIPLNTPPTFFFPKSHNNAYNIYFVTVEMTSENLEKIINEKVIEITMPFISVDKPFEIEKVTEIQSMKLFSMGENLLRVRLDQGVYSYNEPISFEVQVDNTYCKAKVNGINIVIDRRIRLFDYQNKEIFRDYANLFEGNDTRFEVEPGDYRGKKIKLFLIFKYEKTNHINEINEVNAIYGKIDEYQEEIRKSIYGQTLKEINFLMPTIVNEFYRCEYILKVKLIYENFSIFDSKEIETSFILSSFDYKKQNNGIIDNNKQEFGDAPPIPLAQD